MKIIKDLSPNRTYRFTHNDCCVFEAEEGEFKWTKGNYGGIVGDVICPKCGKQFYQDPEIVKEEYVRLSRTYLPK